MSYTVIVTGSTSGIGLDIAHAYLKRGANVVINGRDLGRLALAAAQLGEPQRLASVIGDVGDRATGEELVRTAVERFGQVDALVNSAGTFGAKAFVEVTEADLDGYLHTNLMGTFLTTQAVVRQLKRQGTGGSIVNLGTVMVEHALSGFPVTAPVVSKGAVQALTVSLAAELAAERIRVNLVSPGVVRTPMHAGADVDSYGGLALLNRVAEAAEVTAAVLYLGDAEFVTGHTLRVDGGFVTGRA